MHAISKLQYNSQNINSIGSFAKSKFSIVPLMRESIIVCNILFTYITLACHLVGIVCNLILRY